MLRKKTSTFYFQNTCTEVWEAVTKGTENQGFAYRPMSDEEFEQARKTALNKGEVLAKVTDMTPGVSCAYTLFAPKFTVYWNAQFSAVGGDECKMVMEEVYDFPSHAFVQYLLSLMFVRQRQQHKAFRQEIERRLERE